MTLTRATGTWGRAGRLAALALGVAALVGEAGAAELRWKFKAGDTFPYVMDQKTITNIKANGQDIRTTLTQTIDSTWKVESVGPDGKAEMSQTLDRLRTKIESAFGSFEFDSKVEKDPEGPIAAGVVPMLRALVNAKFLYKMNPQGELSDVRVPEGLVEKLKNAGPTAGNMGMFSEEGLKNMIHESSLALPAKDLKLGDGWTRQSKIPSPPIGTLVMDKSYKYEGPTQNGELIGLQVKIALEGQPAAQVDIKLGEQEGKGSFVFDNENGRVAQSTVSEKVQMVIKVMNQEITQSTETSTSMKLAGAKTAEAAPKAEEPKK